MNLYYLVKFVIHTLFVSNLVMVLYLFIIQFSLFSEAFIIPPIYLHRQKWMHAHRIGLLLEHDMPLGKHLQVPNSSGHFHIVWCRQAQLQIGEFLREFCTFMLMENHSYIKFVFEYVCQQYLQLFFFLLSCGVHCLPTQNC